jgi:hypothetical protein
MNSGTLIWLAPVWPVIAIVCAVILYVRHCRVIEPARRVSPVVYVLGAIIGGVVGGLAGIGFGIKWACAGPDAGNLCGLVGFFVTGPIAGSVGVVLVALALSLVRPEPQHGTGAAGT